jgi:hypothetical protein
LETTFRLKRDLASNFNNIVVDIEVRSHSRKRAMPEVIVTGGLNRLQ